MVLIISGAGSRGEGISVGRAAAILANREGARVALLDVVPEWAEETRQQLDRPAEAIVIQTDVTREESCQSAVAAVVARWGRVDALVNVVGGPGPAGDAVHVDLDGWDRGLRLNLTSMMLMSRAAIPDMERGGGGSIIHISSVGGLIGGDASLLYPTTKGAIVQMTRTMAGQHARAGIRVNCIAPGVIYTPFVVEVGGVDEELRAQRAESTLLGTEGTAWDVAWAIVYLASQESRWVTGVILPVDGGVTSGRLPSTQLVAKAQN